MLIFNTYYTLNLKEKKRFTALINFRFGYITIHPIITNVQKILFHTGGGCLATRQKCSNLAIKFIKTIAMATRHSLRTSDSGNGNHSVSLPIILIKSK